MRGGRTSSGAPIGGILATRNYGGGSSSSGSGGSGGDSWSDVKLHLSGLVFFLALFVILVASFLYMRVVVIFGDFLLLSYPNANSINRIIYIIGFIIYCFICWFFAKNGEKYGKIFYYFFGMIAVYFLFFAILFVLLHIIDVVFNIATGHDAPPPFTVCPECPPGNFQLIDFVSKVFLPFEYFFSWFFSFVFVSK